MLRTGGVKACLEVQAEAVMPDTQTAAVDTPQVAGASSGDGGEV